MRIHCKHPIDESPFTKELEMAKLAAQKSNFRIRHGALIVDRNQEFFITAYNGEQHGNSFFRQLYSERFPNKMLHAEFAALGLVPYGNILAILTQKLVIDVLRGARMCTYRLSKTGIPGNSRPCKDICWPGLKDAGFKDAVYITHYNDQLMVAHEYF